MDESKPTPEKASHAVTNQRIREMVEPFLTRPLRVLDVGCGSGYFLRDLAKTYQERGWPIESNLLGIDIDLSSYRAHAVPTRQVDINRPLPFADQSYDLVLAIEVFEHTRAPYLLMQEVARILAPGGRIIISVPNVMHALSRLSYLLTGHYYMYPTPSAVPSNAGRLMGHIEPLPLQYWHYGLRYAGFTDIACTIDRRKKGAMFAAALLKPFTMAGSAWYARKIQKYDANLAKEVSEVLPAVNSFDMLTSRSLIFSANKP
ncbi:MAG TPA: class I SAM-dependent methyltransferase [Pseudolabrys sp.]|jgi:SAM-dependent methyltransferase|nr:class I SAM-dependent methyltransferase [Pseudolabrys sp.]